MGCVVGFSSRLLRNQKRVFLQKRICEGCGKCLGVLALILEIAGDAYSAWKDEVLVENFEFKEA